MTTEAAQHCCFADCPAEEEPEDEEAAAHKVAATTAVHDHIVLHMPTDAPLGQHML